MVRRSGRGRADGDPHDFRSSFASAKFGDDRLYRNRKVENRGAPPKSGRWVNSGREGRACLIAAIPRAASRRWKSCAVTCFLFLGPVRAGRFQFRFGPGLAVRNAGAEVLGGAGRVRFAPGGGGEGGRRGDAPSSMRFARGGSRGLEGVDPSRLPGAWNGDVDISLRGRTRLAGWSERAHQGHGRDARALRLPPDPCVAAAGRLTDQCHADASASQELGSASAQQNGETSRQGEAAR